MSFTAPALTFTLTNTSPSTPPTLLVTLTNHSLTTPYTLLKWSTPLDSAALNTGVFSITDADSAKEAEQVVLKVNRKMPPASEELVTLAPGAKVERILEFDKGWMPGEKGKKYRVKAAGTFKGLWDRYGADVSENEVMAYTESPFSGTTFETNEAVMEGN